jgi:hypothetical protein
LKTLGTLAIELVIIALFVASFWWAADKIKKTDAFSPDQIWLVD